ncbi:indole-3-glycerol-phosphate synthase [Solilutibacter silvestris]|uniref:indole-3-glycerol-phosphate synthase n=1 Tax=Solilutibacter silvestris TaxID=1645665 RepID=A0A2K1PXE5_9GAMM|nr:indole-3-glycerol-phosphate synthase [Lysobacter silvestris]PNS07463.1 Indole-3-glycerol phosphate synthase [Lysobacter silvestris]
MSVLPSLHDVLRDARLPADSHLSRVVESEAARITDAVIAPATQRAPSGRFERSLRDAKAAHGGAVIAEFKRASPSLGMFAAGRDFDTQLQAYRDGGAAAVSILAEPALFRGSADEVRAGQRYGMPRLYKGFVLDVRHLDEAATIAQADAVLLIARMLGKHTAIFADAARARGLEPLVELHELAEIPFARDSGAALIGINARDLASFAISTPTAAPLRDAFPDAVLIRESGLAAPKDAHAAFAQGFDAALIGEALMRSDNPTAFLQECKVRG